MKLLLKYKRRRNKMLPKRLRQKKLLYSLRRINKKFLSNKQILRPMSMKLLLNRSNIRELHQKHIKFIKKSLSKKSKQRKHQLNRMSINKKLWRFKPQLKLINSTRKLL